MHKYEVLGLHAIRLFVFGVYFLLGLGIGQLQQRIASGLMRPCGEERCRTAREVSLVSKLV